MKILLNKYIVYIVEIKIVMTHTHTQLWQESCMTIMECKNGKNNDHYGIGKKNVSWILYLNIFRSNHLIFLYKFGIWGPLKNNKNGRFFSFFFFIWFGSPQGNLLILREFPLSNDMWNSCNDMWNYIINFKTNLEYIF